MKILEKIIIVKKNFGNLKKKHNFERKLMLEIKKKT